MRLIDADALKYSMMLIAPGEMTRYCYPCEEILKEIDDAPTIEERKNGKWILDPKSGRYRCSECLAVAARDDFGKEYLSDYCTVCGADMRGSK